MSRAAEMNEIVKAFEELLKILIRLRAPDGCPWDRKQTWKSMAPLILEEAFEAADAADAGRPEKVAEELGDLLMNTLLTGLIAEEQESFTMKEVFNRISTKLVNRHPHVFGDKKARSVDTVLSRWEEIKKSEREAGNDDSSAVAGVPRAMPGLLRAFRVAEKLKRTGADLPPLRNPVDRARAMFRLLDRLGESGKAEDLERTVGEVLLSLCNMAALLGVNPEMALRSAVDREEKSFRRVESALGDRLRAAGAEEVDNSWQEE